MSKSLARYIVIFGIISYLSSCTYHPQRCKAMLEAASQQTYDVIIIPGFKLDSTGWPEILINRIYWSKYLFDQGIAKNIMYSGAAVYYPYCEAKAMALYAEAIGIPKEHIFIETKAEHSTENVYYSYHKAKGLNFEKIAVATDPFQAKMITRFTRKKVSPGIDFIPINYDMSSEL